MPNTAARCYKDLNLDSKIVVAVGRWSLFGGLTLVQTIENIVLNYMPVWLRLLRAGKK